MTPIRVVINADDFGLVPEIDSVVERAHLAGTVTSATLMVTGVSAENAAAVAKRNPGLGVGLHVDLVWGRPAAVGRSSLVDARGRFHSRRGLIARALTGRLRRSDVDREVRAQLARFRSFGLRPTHLDAHQHAQVIPLVSAVIAEIARGEGLPVRVPRPWRRASGTDRLPQRLSLALFCVLAEHAGVHPATAEFTSVFDERGPVTGARYMSIVRRSRGPTLELMVHPSDPSERLRAIHPDMYEIALAEARALLEPGLRPALEAFGAVLTDFRGLT